MERQLLILLGIHFNQIQKYFYFCFEKKGYANALAISNEYKFVIRTCHKSLDMFMFHIQSSSSSGKIKFHFISLWNEFFIFVFSHFVFLYLVCTISTSQIWSISVVTGLTSSIEYGATENACSWFGWNINTFTSWCDAKKYSETRNATWFHSQGHHWSSSSAIFRT